MSSRRNFLRTAAGIASLPFLSACGSPPTALESGKWFQLSLAQWSFHRALFAGELKHLDFAGRAADLGFHGVEYVNAFFKNKAEDSKLLAEMKLRCADANVQSLLIMCDGEGALGDANKRKRGQAVTNHIKWLDAAKELGCHSIRVNAQSSGNWDEQVSRAADGLHQLCTLGSERGLNVIVENHGGLSSNGKWLAQVMQMVSLDNCGTLPDFGNFNLGDGQSYDRYLGVTELMPFAKAVSAKSHEFDELGDEVHSDYRRMLQIVKHSGYRGFIGVEYEGSKHSEVAGITLTRDLLKRFQCS